MLDVLIMLLVVLVVIAAIGLGHGIWVALSYFFRELFGREGDPPAKSPFETRCSRCGASLGLDDVFCPVCGRWQKLNSDSSGMAELGITAQQMDRFLIRGLLDTETHKRVMQVIADERERMMTPSRPEQVASSRPATEPEPELQPRTEEPATIPPRIVIEPVTVGLYEKQKPVVALHQEPLQTRVTPPALPIEPRRTFTEILATFMEESSIKWGELMGGLLIIGCSIALVISLWSQIASRPFVKFSIFSALTASLFGLGFYSAHRWKLPTTSRGVLIIATLLVPLNFLAMTAFSFQRTSSPVLAIGGEIMALGLFLFLVYQAARVIEGEPSWTMVMAVLGPSFAMLMTKHWGDHSRALWLGATPVLCYWASVGGILWEERGQIRGGDLEEGTKRIYLRLGIASFATLLPLGLLIQQGGSLAFTIRQFAPLICSFAVPAIACSVLLLQRGGSALSGEQRTASMSIGMIGSMVALAGVVIAWPNPVSVITTAAINFGIYIVVALAAEKKYFKYAHMVAVLYFTVAYLVICNLLGGGVRFWMNDGASLARALTSAISGASLLALFMLLASIAETYRKTGKVIESRIYSVAAVIVGAVSLSLVSFHGFGRMGDPNQAGLIYAIYAAISFTVAWRRQERLATWIGAALSLLAIEQTLAFRFGDTFAPYHPTRLSLISFTSLSVVAIVLLRKAGGRARNIFELPLAHSALISSFVLAPLVLFGGWMTNLEIAARLFWLSIIWLIISLVNGRRSLFLGGHAAFTLAVTLSVSALIGHRWPSIQMWLDPLTLQPQAIALALLSLMIIATRIWLRGKLESDNAQEDFWSRFQGGGEGDEGGRKLFDLNVVARFLNPTRLNVDSIVNGALVVLLVTLSSVGMGVALIDELMLGVAVSPDMRVFAARAIGAGSWLLLLALLLVFTTQLWLRFERWIVPAMQFLVAAACLLLAGRWQLAGSMAISTCWSMAIGLSLITCAITQRDRIQGACRRVSRQIGLQQLGDDMGSLVNISRRLSFGLFAFPVILLTLMKFNSKVSWAPLISIVQTADIIQIISELILFTVPLLIVAVSVLANGLRDKSVVLTCVSGLLLNLTVTLGSLLVTAFYREELGRTIAVRTIYLWEGFVWEIAIRTIHLNVIVTSLFSIAWLAFANRWSWREPRQVISAQLAAVVGISLALLGLADIRLFIDPDGNSVPVNAMGSMWAWVSVAVTGAAYARYRGWKSEQLTLNDFGAAAVAFGSLLACSLSLLDNDWIAFRALMIVLVATALFMVALRWIEQSGFENRAPKWIARIGMSREAEIWALALGIAALLMTLRGFDSRWWTVGACITICLLFTALGGLSRNRGYVYLAGILPNLAAFALYGSPGIRSRWFYRPDAFFLVSLATFSLTAMALLALDLHIIRKEKKVHSIKPFHRIAARIALVIMWIEFVLADLIGVFNPGEWNVQFHWIVLGPIIGLLAACLWDDESDFAPRWLWGAGLLVTGEIFVAIRPDDRGLITASVVALSLYALLTSVLFNQTNWLSGLISRLRIPASGRTERNRSFIVAANSNIARIVALLMVFAVLRLESLPQRLITATASFAIPISLLLLSNRFSDAKLVTRGLRFSLLNAVAWGWAWLSPLVPGRLQVLQRLTIVMMISEAIILTYRFILLAQLASDNAQESGETPLEGEIRGRGIWAIWRLASDNAIWNRFLKVLGREIPALAITGLVALGGVLGIETWSYISFGISQMTMPMMAVVTLTLLGLILTCIAFALLPGEDPLNLDERGKMQYVYAAEVILMLLLMHVRVTMPWMFSGLLLPWWPLIVMFVAFAGVGLGEMFRRQGRLVLAQPLERTGIILPLLPVVGFWAVDSEVPLSGLLLLVGLFYSILSVMRRSFAFGILAALAGNSGLWQVLNGVEGAGFYEHPQLWLIPLALSVLVAAWINRDHLEPDRMTAIRYMSLVTIYVSSTADIFINGVAASPWLPIVLAALSVGGVITGLMMRVRAFLFLGTAFLLLSIVTMIWTASVNFAWDWLWYVTGIILGVLILYIVAMFERKRNEMMELVERLKQWQA